MHQVLGSLALIALGMVVDAMYHRKVRLVEREAYKDGYQAALMDHVVFHDPVRGDVPLKDAKARVELPEGFEDHMRQNGRATARLK